MVLDPFYEVPSIFEVSLGTSWIHSALNDVVISLMSVVHHSTVDVAVLIFDQSEFPDCDRLPGAFAGRAPRIAPLRPFGRMTRRLFP
jgi:hypothetical protein